jgi:hypothetical protein
VSAAIDLSASVIKPRMARRQRNFGEGWFVGTVPIITENEYERGTRWTVPLGAQAGRLIKVGGKLPVNPTRRRLLQCRASSASRQLAIPRSGGSDFLIDMMLR